jgi:cysteine-S-conjugate beta-lyase
VPEIPDFDAIPLAELRRRRSTKWRWYPPDVLPAFVAELDVPLAAPIRAALHDAVELGDAGYVEPGALPEAFAGFAADRLGWQVDPGQVLLMPDIMLGATEILRVATRPGDGVVVNPPVYPPFFATLNEIGRQTIEVPLRHSPGPDTAAGYDLDLGGLRAAFAAGARAYLLCSPHNPVGRVWSAQALRQVAELAADYDVLVISDEVHAPLVLPGATHTPFLALGRPATDCGVVLSSASKAWNVAGLKCAVAVTAGGRPRALLRQIPQEFQYGASILGVVAAEAAFTDGRPWLDALVVHLDRNRTLAAELLAEGLPGVRYQPPEASYLGWLDCTALGLGNDPAAAFLERGRVALSPGPGFGRQGAGFARLNLGTSRDLLTEAVRRMRAAVTP